MTRRGTDVGMRAGAMILAAAMLAGCAMNPATGRPSLTGLSSAEAETQVGREQHGAVIEAFGGAYDGAELQSYVNEVGQRVAARSERADVSYTFTVLNTQIVNALAIPGGYIYVTRGLLALVNNEAELAGVLGHEIGHVAAMHHAQQQSRESLTRFGLAAVSVATGSPMLTRGTQLAATGFLRSFSRDEEYEADSLGIRYVTRAGYDPQAMVAFLATMRENERLQATMEGRAADSIDEFDYFSTHPQAIDRYNRALAEASERAGSGATVGREQYLKKIDGMLYGEPPSQGFIRGRAFEHPGLRIRFEVPPGFELFDTPTSVYALGPHSALIVFDAARETPDVSMADYVAKVWAKGAPIRRLRSGKINGMEAASTTVMASSPRGPVMMRLVAIRVDATHIYRFRFEAPPNLPAELEDAYARTTGSFRTLTAAEAAALKARRINIVTVKPGDTAERLSAKLPFTDYRVERFRVLNGLGAAGQPVVGTQVKLIVE